jgi:hypothetical protein
MGSTLAGQTERTTTYKEDYALLEVNDFEFEGETNRIKASALANATYKSRVVINARLLTKLPDDERINIEKASHLKDVGHIRTDVLAKIKAYDPIMANEVEKNVKADAITTVFLETLRYEIILADLKMYYCNLTNDFTIKLNDGLTNSSQSDFNKKTGHEFKHADYALNNYLESVKWNLIRTASQNQTLFNLADAIGNNTYRGCGCSASDGHEKRNPENCIVCSEENNY